MVANIASRVYTIVELFVIYFQIKEKYLLLISQQFF